MCCPALCARASGIADGSSFPRGTLKSSEPCVGRVSREVDESGIFPVPNGISAPSSWSAWARRAQQDARRARSRATGCWHRAGGRQGSFSLRRSSHGEGAGCKRWAGSLRLRARRQHLPSRNVQHAPGAYISTSSPHPHRPRARPRAGRDRSSSYPRPRQSSPTRTAGTRAGEHGEWDEVPQHPVVLGDVPAEGRSARAGNVSAGVRFAMLTAPSFSGENSAPSHASDPPLVLLGEVTALRTNVVRTSA